MSGPVVLGHVLVGIALALESEMPHVGPRRVIRAVQAAHGSARQFLPDLSAYREAVTQIARATMTGFPLVDL